VRKSLELDEKEWSALDRLAEATRSLATTRNSYGGQPSWRVFVQRLAKSERTKEMIQQNLYQEWLDEIILNWHNRYDELPDEEVIKWEAGLSEAERQEWEEYLTIRPAEREMKKWHVAKNLFYRRSLTEARRLGYEPNKEIAFSHNPIAMIEFVQGYENGIALMNKWGFGSDQPHPDDPHYIAPHYEPDTMWDVMAWRRNDDAVIAVIGDDRGWKNNWTYYIAVAWSPRHLDEKYGPTYCLV